MIKVNFSNQTGIIKPMHAVNNGPVPASREQTRENFDTFKALDIPYVRNHDASFFAAYGGEHTVDVHAIFPDFNKDENDETSYDFTYTDMYTSNIYKAGAKVFYRLGSKIEHGIKKYGTLVPPDFKKWAGICEHIIMHYTEGWANGFKYDVSYWEIWNEADGVNGNGDQPNWSGSALQYYEMYDIAARHLKKRFPHLNIGGPALSFIGDGKWLDGFLKYITKSSKAPLDFFSWHIYTADPKDIASDSRRLRKILDSYGYNETKIICNEWNYVENFGERWIASIEHMIGMHGAAFMAAAMLNEQKDINCDMLMYYDVRPCTMNGVYDFYTLRPIKGYYVLKCFSNLYKLSNETECVCDDENIYACAASDGDKCAVMLVNYSSDLNAVQKKVKLDFGKDLSSFAMYIIDKENNLTQTLLPPDGELCLYPDTVAFFANYPIG